MTRRRDVKHAPTITVPAGAPAWVTPELLTHTLRVWQPYYRHGLTELDLLEILLSAANLVRTLADDAKCNPHSTEIPSE